MLSDNIDSCSGMSSNSRENTHTHNSLVKAIRNMMIFRRQVFGIFACLISAKFECVVPKRWIELNRVITVQEDKIVERVN